MTDIDLERRAFEISEEAHRGMMYGDSPYTHHTTGVANSLRSSGFNSKVVAIGHLHDLFEDTVCDARYLLEHGFPLSVIWSVECLNHTGQGPEKILKARKQPASRVVKHADSKFNLHSSRLARNQRRIDRYSGYIQAIELGGIPTVNEVHEFIDLFDKGTSWLTKRILDLSEHTDNTDPIARARIIAVHTFALYQRQEAEVFLLSA